MKFKKFVAALSAVTMLGSLAVVPANAADETVAKTTVFSTDENTSWYLHESKDTANCNATVYANAEDTTGTTLKTTGSNNTAIGYKVKLNSQTGDNSKDIVQVRPTYQSGAPTLSKGITYTISLDYTINIESMDSTTDSDSVVYVRIPNGDGTNYTDKVVYTVKNGTGEKSGTYTSTFTVVNDIALNLQLYLRHAKGTVEYSNITITYTTDEQPSDAVAQNTTTGTYYSKLQSAVDAAAAGETVKLLSNYTGNLTCDKAPANYTIDLNNYEIVGTVYLKNGKQITIKNGTVKMVQLETGTSAKTQNGTTRNMIVIDNATVTEQITTDASRLTEYRSAGANDVNRNGIKVVGNSTLTKGIKIVAANQNSNILDTLDIQDYTGTTNISVEIASMPYAITEGAVFFTGDASKVTIIGADNYELKDGALVTKTVEPTTHSEAFKFTKKASDFSSNAQVNVVFQNDNTNAIKEYTEELGTTFTGQSDVQIAVVIKGIAEGYSVKSVTIE